MPFRKLRPFAPKGLHQFTGIASSPFAKARMILLVDLCTTLLVRRFAVAKCIQRHFKVEEVAGL